MTALATATRPIHVTLVRAPLISRDGALNNEASPAIGMAYVAGYLKRFGYEVDWIDGTAEGLNQVHDLPDHPGFQIQGITVEEVVERIPEHTDVIAFGSMFSAEWVLLRDLINATRGRFPDKLFVAGGEHFTALPEHSLRDCPALDVIVKGEGEHTMYELLEAWSSTGGYEQVNGVCFLDELGGFVSNGGLPRIRDPQTVPWPWWPEGYLEKFWAAGKSYGVRTERDMPMLASRGCPYRCTFCSSAQMWTTSYVLRDIDDIVAEIKHYIQKYNITSFQLYDLTAFTKKSWTLEFCKRLKQEDLGLTWSLPSGTRSEVLEEEVLGLLKETGCNYMAYAPESGSPKTLKVIKKQVKLDRLVESIKKAKRAGLIVRTNLIIGFPHETRREVWQTLLFGARMAILGVDEAPYFIFSSYPGTEIFKSMREQGRVELNDEYFMSLVSFNGKFSMINAQGTSNPNMCATELAALRLGFMLLNYGLGYLLHPRRIFRTIGNVFSNKGSATVLENRLQDMLHKKKAKPKQLAAVEGE